MPQGLARRLVAFLEETTSGYASLNEFVSGAVANQLNLLSPVDGKFGFERISASHRTIDVLSRPTAAPSKALPVRSSSMDALFVLTNRFAPIKIATRALANLYSDGVWPALAEFQREAATAARRLGLELRAADEDAKRVGYQRRWIGFPIGEDVVAAQNRFITSFTIQQTRGSGASGPLMALGLANLSGERVGLTEKGIQLAMLPSPLLAELAGNEALSAQEAEIIASSLLLAPMETQAVREFLCAVGNTSTLQSRIDRELAKAHPDWTDVRITSHRAAMTGRLRDLRLIDVSGKGPTSRIEMLKEFDTVAPSIEVDSTPLGDFNQ